MISFIIGTIVVFASIAITYNQALRGAHKRLLAVSMVATKKMELEDDPKAAILIAITLGNAERGIFRDQIILKSIAANTGAKINLDESECNAVANEVEKIAAKI